MVMKPELKVVRFKEADVIVASALPNYAYLSGFNDATGSNGKVTYNEKNYTYSGRNDLLNLLSGAYSINFSDGAETLGVNTLFEFDNRGFNPEFADGKYIFDANSSTFKKQ